MRHLNGDLLCAVDCETSGLKPRYHSLIQVCVLPLDNELLPHKQLLPFYMAIKPEREVDLEALRVNKLSLKELMATAEDPFVASEKFERWFNRLGLGLNKKIVPLGHNFAFDAEFLKDWLGEDSYNTYFGYRVRDTSAASLFLNDRASFAAEPCPYPKMGLGECARRMGIDNKNAHDAMQDCLMTAELYRRMIHATLGVSWTPAPASAAAATVTPQSSESADSASTQPPSADGASAAK